MEGVPINRRRAPAALDLGEIVPVDSSAVTIKRLQLCFATLCCLGGVVLAGVEETATLPYIAVFFAVFGFVFVDWLELFALPPLLAYIAMGCVAIYCVGNFWDGDSPGNTQMVSVANLLVMVQSILMLQKKTLRIFEQLTVFCLLQLVVAAVFNHAISYGLLLIPICFLASIALGLLSSLAANDAMTNQGVRPLFHRPPSLLANQVSVSGRDSFDLASRAAGRLPRTVLISVVPAVVMIAAIFFYALPRTADSARPDGQGPALVGFSDHLNLQQIGQMQQSGRLALRVRLRNRREPSKPYITRRGIYLRGRVLERYETSISKNRSTQTMWSSSVTGNISSNMLLPEEFVPKQERDKKFYDSVDVDITCESVRSPTLFAIAPYYQIKSDKRMVHDITGSTLSRKNKGGRIFPRYRYAFLTHGFRNGIQTKFIAQPSLRDSPMASGRSDIVRSSAVGVGNSNPDLKSRADAWSAELSAANLAMDLQENLLVFNRARTPTAKAIADRIVAGIPAPNRNPMRISSRLESYLSTSDEYSYTLNLDMPTDQQLDPIEQFLSVNKAGHCQFFASAMVMMLRSQGIPARIVIGFRTDEYNELGEYYIVRQLHAHAWVEALINREFINNKDALCGQPSTDNYWVRLDPTPSYSLSAASNAGGVSQVFDLAQNIWDDYVVDMDSQRQTNALSSGANNGTMLASYGRFFSWIESRVAAIRAGQLGGGSLAGRPVFSWTAAMITIALGVVLFALSRIPIRRWRRGVSDCQFRPGDQQPRYTFYQETLDELARLGIERGLSQTPVEVAAAANESAESTQEAAENPDRVSLGHSLDVLTSIYNRVRYGGGDDRLDDPLTQRRQPLTLPEPDKSRADTALQRLRLRIDTITTEKPSI